MRYIRSKILKFIKLVTNREVWKLVPLRSAGDLSTSGTAGGIQATCKWEPPLQATVNWYLCWKVFSCEILTHTVTRYLCNLPMNYEGRRAGSKNPQRFAVKLWLSWHTAARDLQRSAEYANDLQRSAAMWQNLNRPQTSYWGHLAGHIHKWGAGGLLAAFAQDQLRVNCIQPYYRHLYFVDVSRHPLLTWNMLIIESFSNSGYKVEHI